MRATPCRLVKLAVAGLMGLAVTACYMPDRKEHATLKIERDGAFSFNGHPTSEPALQNAITAVHHDDTPLYVEIEASPNADIKVIRTAVADIEAAHARVAFAGMTVAE